MYNIAIARLPEDPEAQGVIRAADGSWQVVVDKDGVPHLYVECQVETDDGKPVTGLFCVEDLMPDDMKIRDIMKGGTFGGKLSPEEEAAAVAEIEADRKAHPIPCPK